MATGSSHDVPATSPAPYVPRDVSRTLLFHSVMEADADDDAGTLAVAHLDRRFGIVRDGQERSWPMSDLMAAGSCGYGPSPFLGFVQVGISTDARDAWFLAVDGSKTPPYHRLSAACAIDVATGAPRSLRRELGDPPVLDAAAIADDGLPSLFLGRRVAVLWGGRGEVDLVRRASRRVERLLFPDRDGDCDAAASADELVVACETKRDAGRLALARFDLVHEPALPLLRADVAVGADAPKLRVSRDGRYVAYYEWGPTGGGVSALGVVDARAARVLFERRERPAIDAAGFTPAGRLLVGHDGGTLELLSPRGDVEARFHADCHARDLFGSPSGDAVWCLTYGDGLALFPLTRR